MSAVASQSSVPVALALAIGLGCDRGTPLATVQQCLQQALALAGGTLADVAVLASIEAKADEAAFCNWPHSVAGLCTGTAPRNWRLCPCPTLGHRAALHGHPR